MKTRLFVLIALAIVLNSCEAGIVFTEAQPVGVQSLEGIPADYHGSYAVSETRSEKSVESHGPDLIICDDSLLFMEYRTAELHKNFVDGASYKLLDNYLYRDGKKISMLPAELHGDTYTYVRRIDSIPLILREGQLIIEAEDTVFSLPAEIRTGADYFVLNLFSEFRQNTWTVYVFRKTATDKLEIRTAPAFSKINEQSMQTTYKAKTDASNKMYIVNTTDKKVFEKLAWNVFVPVLVLQQKD